MPTANKTAWRMDTDQPRYTKNSNSSRLSGRRFMID
jgi:hypothetical protein